jgi:hypothetical protein
MTHPFVGDLSQKTIDELQDTISSLNSKLSYMARLNKMDMVRQLNMILDSYRLEYSKRQKALWDKKSENMDNKINIS